MPSQLPAWRRAAASAGGPNSCPVFDPMTMSPPVAPISATDGAYTGAAASAAAGMRPPATPNPQAIASRSASGRAAETIPSSVTAMPIEPMTRSSQIGAPRPIAQPPR